MGRYKTLGVNSLYTFVGQIGSKVIALVMLPFYTKWLSVEDYGLTDVISVYASLVMCIATLSIHEAIFVFPVNQPFEKQRRYFSTALTSGFFSIISVVVVFILLGIIGTIFNIRNSFFDYLGYIALVFVSLFLQSFSQEFCRSINKMQIYCISGLIVTGLTALLAFFLIPEFGLPGFIYSLVIANFGGVLFSVLAAKEYKYFSFGDIDKVCWAEMAKYTVPLIPNATLWWIISALNRPVMESSLGLAAIGLFAVANRIPGVVSMVMSIFNNSWQLSVLQEYRKDGFNSFFSNIAKLYVPFSMITATFVSLFCKDFFSLFIDEKFFEGWKYAPLLALAVVGTSASSFYGSIFSAVKKSKYFLYSSIVGGVVTIILNILLIPWLGLWGAVISFILSHFSICFIRIYYSSKYVELEGLLIFGAMLLLSTAICLLVIGEYVIISWTCFAMLVALFILINWRSIKQAMETILILRKKVG